VLTHKAVPGDCGSEVHFIHTTKTYKDMCKTNICRECGKQGKPSKHTVDRLHVKEKEMWSPVGAYIGSRE